MEEKQYTDENTIIELSVVGEDTLFDEPIMETTKKEEVIKVKKSQKKKTKKEFFWNRLSKKQKVLIILGIVFVLLVATGLVLYFVVFKKEDKEPEKEVENVVIEKDNYIYDNGKLKLLDSDDKVIGIYECIEKDDKKCYVASLTTETEVDIPKYLDEDDNEIVKNSKIYNKRFVFIYDEEKIVLYDIEKETKTGEYLEIKIGEIEEDLVVVKDINEKYGIIEFSLTDANVLLDFEYEYLAIGNDSEVFMAKEGSYSYLIDKDGKELTSNVRGSIRSFNDKYLAVYDDDYYLYDYTGQKMFEDAYEYIDFNKEYIFVINNKKLYAYDTDLLKLNETAIKLKNEDYLKTYIFDEDNNLVETKKAYSITFTEGDITFELSDETTKVINLYEVALNKNLAYVNYYDGKLYFYNDVEKKDLIGSYDCTNKNTVNSKESTFANCMVAKESNILNTNANGYIPIINGGYVFIKDTREGSTVENIVLYDIKNGSQRAKYQAVDTGIGAETINHVSSLNGIISAKNSEGQVGVITFSANGPAPVIKFKDESNGGKTKNISILGDYFYVERESKNYLYPKTGGDPVAESKFTIISLKDNYLLVKDSKYHIHDNEAGTVIAEGFDHIEMFDKFFVGIKGNKLNTYKYDDAKTSLIEEDIEITTTDITKGYTFAVHSDAYVLSVVAAEDATVEYKFNKEDWSKVE